MQGPMFQIRGWYKRFGLAVPNWRKRSDDHLVHQLDFLVHLFVHTDGTEGLEEAARFMDEHPLRWMERFSHRVASRAATPFYAGLSVLTAAYLDELRDVLADVLETSRPTAGEIDRRMKPTHEEVVAMPDRYVPGTSPSW